jgi:CheY-like chemotaxis protein/DNA-binding CsgD family transcriptional regulator
MNAIDNNKANTHDIVMIIDDTPENLAVLSDTLSEAGYRILVATDGSSALEQINFLKPDIILLDVLMPGIDGFETCNRLKKDPATATIPVLFMTALSELDDLLRGFNEGAVDYIVKPIRPSEVLVRVEAQLNQVRIIRRAEVALQKSAISVFTVTAEGRISWLPEAGRFGLADFVPDQEIRAGYLLPEPLLSCFLSQIKIANLVDPVNFELKQVGVIFSCKLACCYDSNEYLLMLEKRKDTWDLDVVRSSLGLTPREAEILMWISRGKTNKEVGLILGNSPRTVNKHLEHIFEKLGVVTRAAAVSIVMQSTSN